MGKGDIARTPNGLCQVIEDENVVQTIDMGFLVSSVKVRHLEDSCEIPVGAIREYGREYLLRTTDEEKTRAKL